MITRTLLTQSQIQGSIDVDPLLNTVTDYLHFVTEFFDVICQSGPHIYHSALQLAPLSSVVRNQYFHQTSPISRIVAGIPISWDSCIASAGGTVAPSHAVWSPCGQFIAVGFGDTIQIRDSITLERVSVFSLPSSSVQSPSVSLAFSPDGCLLACNYLEYTPYSSFSSLWEVAPELIGNPFTASLPNLGRLPLPAPVFIWDVQTGTIIYNIKHWEIDSLVFSGNHQTVTLLGGDGTFRTYNGVNGICMHKDKVVTPPGFVLNAHWIHNKSLLFPTISKNGEKLMVNIQELQPTLTPPLSLIVSFFMPLHDGEFSFSPVSLHASFTTKTEVIILNTQDSKTLLQVKAPSSPYTPPGHFSSDGCFFACGTEEFEICVWKSTSDNYVPWCNLWPRLPFKGFSFSPTKSLILTWGEMGIQLLGLSDHLTIPSSKEPKYHQQCKNHLVAYSADGTYVAIVQQEDCVITILDTILNTPIQSFNTRMPILDIKISHSTIFVVGRNALAKWHLEMGRIVCDFGSIVMATYMTATLMMATLVMATGWSKATLSGNCSHVAFTNGEDVLLYDIQAQRVLCRYTADLFVSDIRFSPDGHKLWFTCVDVYSSDYDFDPCLMELEVEEDGNVTTRELSGIWPWVNLFSPHGQQVEWGSEWVVDFRGTKFLWLPLSWRTRAEECVRWDGNFLAFIDGHHPVPLIIKFQL